MNRLVVWLGVVVVGDAGVHDRRVEAASQGDDVHERLAMACQANTSSASESKDGLGTATL